MTATLEEKAETAATLLIDAIRRMRLPEKVYGAYETYCKTHNAEPNKLGKVNKWNTAGSWSDLMFETASLSGYLLLSRTDEAFEKFAECIDVSDPANRSKFGAVFIASLNQRIPVDRIATREARVSDRLADYGQPNFMTAFVRRVAAIVDGNLSRYREDDRTYRDFTATVTTSTIDAFRDAEWTERVLEQAICGTAATRNAEKSAGCMRAAVVGRRLPMGSSYRDWTCSLTRTTGEPEDGDLQTMQR